MGEEESGSGVTGENSRDQITALSNEGQFPELSPWKTMLPVEEGMIIQAWFSNPLTDNSRPADVNQIQVSRVLVGNT